MILGAGASMAQDVAFVTMTPKGLVKVHEGTGRERRRLAPCSTFKIPNAVIGLETGMIPSPDHVLKYDDKKHRTQKFWPEEWAKDQDLRNAFRVSAIWYFREIADRAGRGTMQSFLDRFGYGNRDTSGWADPFWLGSSLRISPVEQVEFMDRLFRNEYGLTPGNVAAVESFMRRESKDGRELFYKTGACTDREAGPEVWLVGFVQNGKDRTYFAMNAGAASMDDIFKRRIELGKERLAKAGLWR
jgi:beta-lactamase class D